MGFNSGFKGLIYSPCILKTQEYLALDLTKNHNKLFQHQQMHSSTIMYFTPN